MERRNFISVGVGALAGGLVGKLFTPSPAGASSKEQTTHSKPKRDIVLDQGRLKYIWTPETEQRYQHLQQADKVEWRIYKNEGSSGGRDGFIHITYYSFINLCPVRYRFHSMSSNAEGLILLDLSQKLAIRRLNEGMVELTKEEADRWLRGKYISWEEFDDKI